MDLGDDIERVRAATDIVAVVTRYVQLKRAGRNLKACCPFHDEKTPSFNVNPEKQIFKCFGCSAGGSVFDFVMRIERQTFVEALRGLAKEAGIELKREKAAAGERHARDEMLRVLAWAARAFRRNLATEEGAGCRSYLEGRGIAAAEIERFGLGFARSGWRTLLDEAERQRVPLELLVATGVVLKNQEGAVYDAFRNRLMFPIKNAQGQVIAFGGRVLDKSEPKYLNSPESEIFRKRQTVYGIEGLGGLKAGEPVLIMEGYTDVIMATQWGMKGAVATLGTSLTPDQVRLLRRYSDRALLVYDGDRAGGDASLRATPMLLSGGMDLRVVTLPGGEDPCDFFLRRQAAGAGELVAHTRELADFMVEKGAAKFDRTTVDGKRRAATFFADLLAAVDDPVVRDATLARVSAAIDVPAPTIEQLVETLRAGAARRAGPRAAPAAEPVPAPKTPVRTSVARKKAIRDLLDVCLNRPSLIGEQHIERLPDLLSEESDSVRDLVVRVCHRAWIDPEGSAASIMSVVEDESFRRTLGSLLRDGDEAKDLRPQLEGSLRYLENERLRREMHTLADTVMLTGSDDALKRLSETGLRAQDQLKRGRQAGEDSGS